MCFKYFVMLMLGVFNLWKIVNFLFCCEGVLMNSLFLVIRWLRIVVRIFKILGVFFFVGVLEFLFVLGILKVRDDEFWEDVIFLEFLIVLIDNCICNVFMLGILFLFFFLMFFENFSVLYVGGIFFVLYVSVII